MPAGAPRKEAREEISAAEDKTQQIPLVNGPAKAADEVPAQALVRPGGPGTLVPRGSEEGENHAGSEVPQETVPMPAAQWPPAQPAVAEPPTRPPSLRAKAHETRTVTAPRAAEVTPRPGLFTAELRRALPPWALPLLTFQPFSVWLGARVALSLLVLLAGMMLPSIAARGTAMWYGSPAGPVLTPFIDRIGGVWTRWDGQWYLKIATEGYKPNDGTAAFFPLYPWVASVVGWLAAERYIWAGILLSSVFFLAALVLLHRLVRLDFHPEDANRTIFYTAAFPMAFFFWAVYSESLFLFLAVATLLAARSQRWWWAAAAVAFSIWTRNTGLLLLLPLGWELYRAFRPPKPADATDPRAMPPKRPSPFILTSLALPLVSLVGFLVWSAAMFGSPFASIAAQADWNRHFSWPWETVINAFKAVGSASLQCQAGQTCENQSWTYLGALILAFALGALAVKWLRGSYSIYLWAGIIFPLFSATPYNPLLSYPRFLIVLFPLFIVLALAGRNRYSHQIITWTSMALLALYTIRFANWYWVA